MLTNNDLNHIRLTPLRPYTPVTAETFPYKLAQELAAVYHNAPEYAPTMALAHSYGVFQAELADQYLKLQKAGTRFEFTERDPYANFSELNADYRSHKTILIYSGGEDCNEYMAMVEPTSGLTFNLIFRAVHDVLGHCLKCNDFTPLGEENAVRIHSSYFNPSAYLALMLETRAQNAWVAYNPERMLPTFVDCIPTNLDGGVDFPPQKLFQLSEKFLAL